MSEQAAATPPGYEPCEECGVPMDPQQRYCVNCAARRGNGANPSSRYFAQVNRKAKRPLVVAKKDKSAPSARAAAVGFFALLPIAVALGVIVGRGDSGSDDTDALLQALRAQEATAATTASPGAATTAAGGGAGGKAAKGGDGKPPKGADASGGKVIAQTENGVVHEVTGYEPTKQKEEEDTRMVEENPAQVGDTYIKAQQNLPDVIVVGGDGGPAPAGGAEP
jgi:hypothetical protein